MPKEWTAAAIRTKLRPRAKRYATCVARKLYVITEPTGSQSWAVRFNGKKLRLGSVDLNMTGEPVDGGPLSLLMAKQLAARVLRDPEAEYRKAKERKREHETAAGRNFGALVQQFAEEQLQSLRSGRYLARQLGLLIPKNGGEPTETSGLAQRWRSEEHTSELQ